MGCSGRSFAVEGSRRGKPVKSRIAKSSGVQKSVGVKGVWCESCLV